MSGKKTSYPGIIGLMIFVCAMVVFTYEYVEAVPMDPINERLSESKSVTLSIGLNFRHRFEYRNNFGFDDTKDDQDGFHLFRTRIDISFEAAEIFAARVQLQDSRIWETEFGASTAFEDELDIRQAYFEVKDLLDETLSFRIGRQELSYGDQRLIGGFNWSNVAQSFDAAKVTYKHERFSIDGFFARKVIIDDEGINESDDEDDFYGIYSKIKTCPNHTLDVYFLRRETGKDIGFGPNVGAGELEESTIGFRLKGKHFEGLDYTVETAYQFGDFGDQDISAYAFVALAGYTFDVPWSPRMGFEFDLGSGDDDPADDERNTFDNLYPTNHMHYGYMDRASLQNLRNYRFTMKANPDEKVTLQLDLHAIYLDKTTDSLYHAGRKAIRTSESEDVDDHVGENLDFTVKYKFNKYIKILVGYSHFFPGKFLEATGAADDGEFFYVQTSF